MSDNAIIEKGVVAAYQIDHHFSLADIVPYLLNAGRLDDAVNLIDQLSCEPACKSALQDYYHEGRADAIFLIIVDHLAKDRTAMSLAREVAARIRGALASAEAEIMIGVAAADLNAIKLGLRHLATAPNSHPFRFVKLARRVSEAGYEEQAVGIAEVDDPTAKITALAAIAGHRGNWPLFLEAVQLVRKVPREQRAFAYGELARSIVHFPGHESIWR